MTPPQRSNINASCFHGNGDVMLIKSQKFNFTASLTTFNNNNKWLPERPESARARAAAGPLTPPGNRRQVRMLCLRAKCVPLVLAVQSEVALCP